ncbi:MAG: hypothetical protein LAP87_06380 [Acidobacteriia bacterium]|nr:hypothetical protein [Terriglobia bacterium]
MMPQPALHPTLEPSIKIYLQLAWETVLYVRGKVQAGSANRDDDKHKRSQKKFQELGSLELKRQREAGSLLIKEDKQPEKIGVQLKPPKILDMDDEICHSAEFVEMSGFGNCGEQASVAYRYLRRFPIAGLLYINLVGGNHSFVILGAGPGILQGMVLSVQQARKAIGDCAIICDPWLMGTGFAGPVREKWDFVIEEMLDQARPGTRLENVKIECICRCSNKLQITKQIDWIQTTLEFTKKSHK